MAMRMDLMTRLCSRFVFSFCIFSFILSILSQVSALQAMCWAYTMTATNHDGHKVYHDGHSNENVKS